MSATGPPLDAVRAAYDAAAATWDDGPARIYDRLAEALVACVDGTADALRAGRAVLDAGAGTGGAGRAVLRRRAVPVAVDLADAMLHAGGDATQRRAVADVCRLPLRSSAVDAAVSAFCLNHLVDPVAALRELDRVTTTARPVLASVFGAQLPHPAKAQVDAIAAAHGFVAPPWYRGLKALEPLLADESSLAAAAERAGLVVVEVVAAPVDVGLDRPADLVAYRTGMAHLAPFVAGLPAAERHALRLEATEALRDAPPLRPVVVTLHAQASAR